MPNGKTFWADDLGSQLWVSDPSSLPAWRNLQTGVFSQDKPSGVKQFVPSGPYTQEEAQLFPYASLYVEGFPSATLALASFASAHNTSSKTAPSSPGLAGTNSPRSLSHLT